MFCKYLTVRLRFKTELKRPHLSENKSIYEGKQQFLFENITKRLTKSTTKVCQPGNEMRLLKDH